MSLSSSSPRRPISIDADRWYPLLRTCASLALMTVAGSAMYSAIMVLEPAAAEFGAGRGGASLPYTLFMLGFGLGNIGLGWLADRRGILVPAAIGCIALPLGFFFASRAGSLLELGLALFLLSGMLGASFSFGPLVSDISKWFSGRRGLAVGVVISGSYVAGAVWPPILQTMFDGMGWRESYRTLALLTFFTMPALSLLLYRPSPAESGGTADTRHPTQASRPLGFSRLGLQTLVCVAGVACCVAMAMPQVHVVPYVTDLGYEAIRGAEMMSLMLGFGIVSRIVSGWISDRIGGLRTLLLGSALQGLVLVAWMFADSLTAMYLTSMAFGLAQGGIVPSYAIIIRSFFPVGDSGWRIGLALMFTVSGMALGGWIAGSLYDLTGSYTAAFVNAIAFNALNLSIGVLLLRRASRGRGGDPSAVLQPA
ncbi:MAG: MFS transporter [Gammaproteobacteria bacterium]|nr:MFS transporter [Gammaproteobacteria bacterium]